MTTSAGQRQFTKAKTAPLILYILCLPPIALSDPNPHVPYQLTWEIENWETHEIYNRTSHTTPLGTWFRNLYFNLDRVADLEKRGGKGRSQHSGLPLPCTPQFCPVGMGGGDWQEKQRRVSVS